MYIHVGEDVLVHSDEIIAILDKETVNESSSIQEFLKSNDKELLNLSKAEFKSLVITNHQIYLSPLATSTLNKRLTQSHQQISIK